MNSDSDIRFLELATRAIARKATDDEMEELRALIASDPARDAEYRVLQKDMPEVEEVLAMCLATQAPPIDPPQEILIRLRAGTGAAYARMRPRWWLRISTWVWALLIAIAIAGSTYFFFSDRHTKLHLIRQEPHSLREAASLKPLRISETTLRKKFPNAIVDTIETTEEFGALYEKYPNNDHHRVALLLLVPESKTSLHSGKVYVSVSLLGGNNFDAIGEYDQVFAVRGDDEWIEAIENAMRFVREGTRKSPSPRPR